MPNGAAVHKIQGLNFPHLVLVLSAIIPIIGLKPKAAIRPTISIMSEESVVVKPYISV